MVAQVQHHERAPTSFYTRNMMLTRMGFTFLPHSSSHWLFLHNVGTTQTIPTSQLLTVRDYNVGCMHMYTPDNNFLSYFDTTPLTGTTIYEWCALLLPRAIARLSFLLPSYTSYSYLIPLGHLSCFRFRDAKHMTARAPLDVRPKLDFSGSLFCPFRHARSRDPARMSLRHIIHLRLYATITATFFFPTVHAYDPTLTPGNDTLFLCLCSLIGTLLLALALLRWHQHLPLPLLNNSSRKRLRRRRRRLRRRRTHDTPDDPPTTITLGVMNVGGSNAALAHYIGDTATTHGFDITFLSETRCTDKAGDASTANFLAALGRQRRPRRVRGRGHHRDRRPTRIPHPNPRWYAANAPIQEHNNPHTNQQYGVGFLVHDPRLTIEVIARDSSGILAISASHAGSKPVLIIGTYLPPYRSTLIEFRDGVMARICETWRLHRPKHACGYLVGDFNSRIGSHGGCANVDRKKIDTHSKRFISHVLEPLGISSVYGRDAHSTIEFTSRQINGKGGFSAVDHIFTDADNMGTTPLRIPQEWGEIPASVTHRPIMARLPLFPCPLQAPAPAAAVQPARPITTYKNPPYTDKEAWGSIFHATTKQLPTVEALASNPSTTTAELTNAFIGMLTDAMDENVAFNPKLAGATRGKHTFRTYRGCLLSPAAMALFEKARVLRRRIGASRDALERKTLKRRAAEAWAEGQTIAKRDQHAHIYRYIAEAERERRRDPANLHQVLKQTNNVFDATNNRHGLPTELSGAYTTHYRALGTLPDAPLPAHGDANIIGELPQAASQLVMQKTTPEEVYLLLFPLAGELAKNYVMNFFTGPGECGKSCVDHCNHCTRFLSHLRAWDPLARTPTNATVPGPVWKPSLRSGAAAGPDGVSAAVLRWARSPDENNIAVTHHHRVRLCKVLANLMNRFSDDKTLPTEQLRSRTGAIPKGHNANNLQNPDKTRGITVGNVLAKMHGNLLQLRLLHWSISNGIISPEQGGFTPRRGCEHQAYTLTETIKSRWRSKLDAWVMFIDFKKAYDMVSPKALYASLKHVGVDDDIIDTIRNCYDARRTTFTYNSQPTDEWQQTLGVAQGDVLSPLLFNIFIESVVRRLNAHAALKGLSCAGIVIKCLLYADDIVILAESHEQLQLALNLISGWCTDWGMQMNTGTNKTEAMHFPHADIDPATPPTPLVYGSGTVSFVDSYRYLGYTLHRRLGASELVKTLAHNLNLAFTRDFTQTTITRGLSISLQNQLFVSAVLGSVNHLLSLAPNDPGIEEALNDIIWRYSALTMRVTVNKHGLNKLLPLANLHLPSATFLLAREHMRLAASLEHTAPPDAHAHRIFMALNNGRDDSTSAATPERMKSWNYSHKRRLTQWGNLHVPLVVVDPLQPWDISRTVHVTARAVAYAEWRAYNLDLATKKGKVPLVPLNPDAALYDSNPTLFYVRLYGGLPLPPNGLGAIKGITALNTPGPYCTSIAGLTDIPIDKVRSALGAMRGPTALFHSPFWTVAGHNASGTSASPPLPQHTAELLAITANPPANERGQARFKFESNLKSCMLCGSAEHGPVHLCTTCTHPRITAKRAAALTTFNDTIIGIYALLCKAHDETPKQHIIDKIKTLQSSVSEGRFILERVLLTAPWTTNICNTPVSQNWEVAKELASLLSRITYNGKMRSLANTWMSWANKVLTSVCTGWHNDLSEDAHKILVAYGFRHTFQTYRNAQNAAIRNGKSAARGRATSTGPRNKRRSPSNGGRRSAPPRGRRYTRDSDSEDSPAHDGCDDDSTSDNASSGPSSSEPDYDGSPLPPRARLPRSAAKPLPSPDAIDTDGDDELPPRTTPRVPAVMCGGPLVSVPGSTGIWGPPGTPLPYGCEAWDPSVVPSARLGVG